MTPAYPSAFLEIFSSLMFFFREQSLTCDGIYSVNEVYIHLSWYGVWIRGVQNNEAQGRAFVRSGEILRR